MREYFQDNNISNSLSNINNKTLKNPNNLMDMDAKLEITNINISRVKLGLKPIKAIWCKICRLQNQHFWWNCPNIRCNICNGAHLTKNCEMLRKCQYCGSDKHLSQACNDEQGMNLKANRYRKCTLCNKYGHTAMNCNNNVIILRPRFRRRRRRWRKKLVRKKRK